MFSGTRLGLNVASRTVDSVDSAGFDFAAAGFAGSCAFSHPVNAKTARAIISKDCLSITLLSRQILKKGNKVLGAQHCAENDEDIEPTTQ